MKNVIIYTDGSCSGNPGPGGWAALLIYGTIRKECTGAVAETTNNRMELRAALEGLQYLKEPCRVDLHTDSAYLCNAFTQGWIKNWQKNGWRTASKKSVENQDLWKQLIAENERHNIIWTKVKGHANDEYNNLVDGLAVAVRREKFGV